MRIIATEIKPDNWRGLPPEPLSVYINPEIVSVSPATELDYEGCGSIAQGELFGKVERNVEITVVFSDENGVSREITASGLLARIIQHEVDHLNGILFTDISDPKSFISRDYYMNSVRKA